MEEPMDHERAETLTLLNELDVAELRDLCFSVGGSGPAPHPPYDHQLEAIHRIEAGARKEPPVSGILHYPTGAGKTRTALELIARGLKENPEHRFVWATASRNLIRQSMVRMVELSQIFPKETAFAWIRDAEDLDEMWKDESYVDVAFMTRHTLTDTLERVADGRRRAHPWRAHLEADLPMTLIYDECHQLGAPKLQKNWRKFYEAVVCTSRTRRRPFRTIGLSATPVPTRESAHQLLGECIFPPRREGPSTAHGWPFHVFHRVPNATLLDSGVLCPINPSLDESGYFDIPADLLRTVTGHVHLKPPGPNADPLTMQNYSLTFNASVMSDERIVAFLADRLGNRLAVLGKTVVFTPNIATANRLAALIYERFPNLRGSVAAVHSKMAEVHVPGQEQATVQEVLLEFQKRGAKPSLLINVDMLTEGFDDPKIQTIVLARLTLSTNRFWQMIGRGTRGPACGGTNDCNVLDPIKLVRLYDYFKGYQPGIHGGAPVENEDKKPAEVGLDLLPPEIPVARRPPDPAACRYELDPKIARINMHVAAALADFLRPMSERIAVEAAHSACIDLSEGRPVVRLSAAFDGQMATAVLLGQIAGLEQRSGHDLAWLRRWLPHPLDEILLRNQMRRLSAIEQLKLWTPSDFARAEMSGAFQRILHEEAVPLAPAHQPSDQSERDRGIRDANGIVVSLSPVECAALSVALTMVAASRVGESRALTYAQRLVIMDTLRRLFGRTQEDALDRAIQAEKLTAENLFGRLRGALDSGQCQTLLTQMVHLATVDGVMSPPEQALLRRIADELQIPPAVMSAISGIEVPSDAREIESGVTCRSCSFDLPRGACFCPACGAAVA
jgi:superfamily II DNA or RNA helicase